MRRRRAVETPRPAGAAAAAACPHRPPCPGCPRFGETGIAAGARAQLDSIARAHGLPPVAVVTGAAAGFRHRARLAIRGRLGSPKIGMFELASHRVVHIPSCRVQHPLINDSAAVVRRALVDARVSCYSDEARRGLARYLQVVVERRSQSAQIVLVANAAAPEPLAECFERVRERLGDALHSLWFNANQEPGNAILGSHFRLWCGPESVVERFGGAAVHYPPGAFGQNNLDVAQSLVAHVRDQVPAGSRVVEFYAGVGAIGLSLLERVASIGLNEVAPQSLRGLELGLAGLAADERAKVTLLPGAAGDACASAEGADVVIADPPRKGLDPPLLAQLAERPPQCFVYVSCALDSFRADLAALTARGRLRLAALAAFDLFPFTAHVETVARFERA